MATRTFAILTGGGDAPGLNAVLRAAVKTLRRSGSVRVLGLRDGFSGLLDRDVVELDAETVRGILPRGGTILGTSSRDDPFQYPIRDGKDWRTVDRSQEAREAFENLGAECLIVVGGDGTMGIATKLGIPMVGVPKTIDNDISGTEFTFGFRTAVETAAMAIDRLHSTAESHHRVLLLEVMGRYSGFIAMHSGLAGGADFILIPEIPYSVPSIVTVIRDRERIPKRFFSIGVVAEGARPIGGDFAVAWRDPATNNPRLGGAADRLCGELRPHVEHEIRSVVLGHLQRGGSPCAEDRILATRFGHAAAVAALERDHGKMVALAADDIVRIPVEDAIAARKVVDPQGSLCRAAREIGVGLGE